MQYKNKVVIFSSMCSIYTVSNISYQIYLKNKYSYLHVNYIVKHPRWLRPRWETWIVIKTIQPVLVPNQTMKNLQNWDQLLLVSVFFHLIIDFNVVIRYGSQIVDCFSTVNQNKCSILQLYSNPFLIKEFHAFSRRWISALMIS